MGSLSARTAHKTVRTFQLHAESLIVQSLGPCAIYAVIYYGNTACAVLAVALINAIITRMAPTPGTLHGGTPAACIFLKDL